MNVETIIYVSKCYLILRFVLNKTATYFLATAEDGPLRSIIVFVTYLEILFFAFKDQLFLYSSALITIELYNLYLLKHFLIHF
jgi:hypothetical protein